MPHHPKPFYRKPRKLWYVQIDGRQHNLGPEREAAFAKYHELMREPVLTRGVAPKSIVGIIDQYLDWCEKHRAPKTYEWYRQRLQLFIDDGIPPELLVSELKPFHVQQWIDSYPALSNGGKRNYCRAVQRTLNWAEEQGYIGRSPLAHFKKPPGGKREMVVSQDEFDRILGCVPAREAHDLLIASWETGARAEELLGLEARHVDLANSRWVFPPSEEKMERAPRIVYLTDEAVEITRRLKLRYPEGKLFRNTEGNAWTTSAVNCLFGRVKKKLGVKYCLTVLRHSWCTRALERGLDALTVAVLMGHADPSMVAKVYGHLSHAPNYLLEQARRVAG